MSDKPIGDLRRRVITDMTSWSGTAIAVPVLNAFATFRISQC
jgi:hypothetical protein